MILKINWNVLHGRKKTFKLKKEKVKLEKIYG